MNKKMFANTDITNLT